MAAELEGAGWAQISGAADPAQGEKTQTPEKRCLQTKEERSWPATNCDRG